MVGVLLLRLRRRLAWVPSFGWLMVGLTLLLSLITFVQQGPECGPADAEMQPDSFAAAPVVGPGSISYPT